VEIINVEKLHEFLILWSVVTQGSQGFLVPPAQLIHSAVSMSDIKHMPRQGSAVDEAFAIGGSMLRWGSHLGLFLKIGTPPLSEVRGQCRGQARG
jgi:hypothetical protein